VISPENCSTILWRSWDFKEQAAEAMKITARDMKENKLIDGIVSEPLGGAHLDHVWMAAELKKVILANIKELSSIKPEKRIDQRIEKFCAMGVVVE
jgi:acetyl-CoA carboxylase carboxyl transferase subunit alpha